MGETVLLKATIAFPRCISRMYLTCKLMAAALVQLLALLVQLATCAHNLEEEYRFSTILDDGYTLHWNFDLEQQTIAFAVNVSTTGWVGFGLSPNGQMPQSDVVIGWVDDDGNTQFHVSSSSILVLLSLHCHHYTLPLLFGTARFL